MMTMASNTIEVLQIMTMMIITIRLLYKIQLQVDQNAVNELRGKISGPDYKEK